MAVQSPNHAPDFRLDPHFFFYGKQSDEGSGSIGQAMSGLEGLTSSFRDLSAWRVSIPRVEQRVDSSSKPYYAFIVDVTRIDVSGG